MLTNFGISINEQGERVNAPLPLSAVYNKQQFISQFVSLHHQSTQPMLINQLLSASLPQTYCEFWILYDEYNHPLACAGANTVISDMSIGYVGLFEAKTEEAGTAVLKAATEWLKRGGLKQFLPVQQILGPVNLTTWLQYRIRVDNDREPSMSFEPRNQEFYQDCFAKAGYVKAADYYSSFFHIDQLMKGFGGYAGGQSLQGIGLAMQPWNTLKFTESLTPERHPELTPNDNVAKRIYDLSIEMFRGKDFFDENFSRLNHRQMVLNDMISRPEVDNASLLDLSSFIVDETTGEDIGYIASWVENNDTLVLKTIGFVPKSRKNKAFAISVFETARRAKDYWGCDKATCALLSETTAAIAERVAGKTKQHVYRLYMYRPQPTTIQNEQARYEHSRDAYAAEKRAGLSKNTTSATVMVAQTGDLLQKREREMHLQIYRDQQRLKHLGQRSRGGLMAHL